MVTISPMCPKHRRVCESPGLQPLISTDDRRSVMPRRPAKVTQADIARAIRAAKEAGASESHGRCRGRYSNCAVGRTPRRLSL